MRQKYYITSIGYNVLGDDLEMTLCEYNNKIEFRQPSFERAWTEIMFETELDALNKLRSIYQDRLLTVLEDTGKIISTFGHESGITSIRIRRKTEGF